jgi:hypothetical protein
VGIGAGIGAVAGFTAGFTIGGGGEGGRTTSRLVTAATSGEDDRFVIAVGVLNDSERFSLNRTPTGLEALKAKPKTMLAPSTLTNCQTIRRAIESLDAVTRDCD